jgi:hypothetical protein
MAGVGYRLSLDRPAGSQAGFNPLS